MEMCYISLKNNNLASRKFEMQDAVKTIKKKSSHRTKKNQRAIISFDVFR